MTFLQVWILAVPRLSVHFNCPVSVHFIAHNFIFGLKCFFLFLYMCGSLDLI